MTAESKTPGWDCADGTPDEDHDWQLVRDWAGDPGVINGTYDIVYMQCTQCGKERDATYDDIRHADHDYEY